MYLARLASEQSGALLFVKEPLPISRLKFPGFVLSGVGMRWSWNPSIEPTRNDHKVYLVVDGFGHNGRIFRERDVETTVTDLMSEQYVAQVRVVAVNPAEHKIEDASEDIALEILRRADLSGQELPSSIKAFVDNYLGTTGSSHCGPP
jgi:hypothetical protein